MFDLKNRWKHSCGCILGRVDGAWVITERCQQHSVNTNKKAEKMMRLKRTLETRRKELERKKKK